MFWGGIVGIGITLLLAIILVALSIRKKKLAADILGDKEIVLNYMEDAKQVSKADSNKLITGTSISQTEVFPDNIKNTLPETQLMSKEIIETEVIEFKE